MTTRDNSSQKEMQKEKKNVTYAWSSTAKIVLRNCSHAMCMKCYREWPSRSQSCPFCRDNLKRVSSGDLWMYTDDIDIIDMATLTRENLRRLFTYIDKLPLVDPDSIFKTYDSRVK